MDLAGPTPIPIKEREPGGEVREVYRKTTSLARKRMKREMSMNGLKMEENTIHGYWSHGQMESVQKIECEMEYQKWSHEWYLQMESVQPRRRKKTTPLV